MDESTTKADIEGADELSAEYANNTQFEPTIWDLKFIFGEFSGRTNSVDWHTSITVPWEQAKLMLYYLALNIAARELQTGIKINVPSSMLPPEPDVPSGSDDTPINRKFFEIVKDHCQRLLDSLK
jgi:hypothetical protein